MKLYEIEQAMLSCIDSETGEIIDEAKLDALNMAKAEKIEGICLWIKNLSAAALALEAEEKNFAERKRVTKNKIESLKKYVAMALEGQPFETTQVKVGFRKSESLDISEGANIPGEFMRFKEPEPDKTALKKAVKAGLVIDGVTLIEKQNINIK